MGYLGIKPANSPLTSELIPDGIISTSDIADGSITTAKIAAAAVVQADLATEVIPVGVGQTWQDVTATRTTGVTYTNSTGRPIFVVFAFYNEGGVLKGINVNGVLVPGSAAGTGAQIECSVSAVVPNGATYLFTPVPYSVFQIRELR
jgi:hypothetical protein